MPRESATFVFDSTNAVLWAEDVAREAGLPVEVVPAPPDSKAMCDLALTTFQEHAASLAVLLDGAGITFGRWP